MKVTRWMIMTSLLGMAGCPITWSNLGDATPPPDAPPKASQPASANS
jgi:hypothetical protein